MLKYLIIQLDDASTSFCHYNNDRTRVNLIPLSTIKEAILWSMKENVSLQFLYPDYILPEIYKNEIDKCFHVDIVSSTCEDTALRENADVVVFDSFAGLNYYNFSNKQACVLRVEFSELFDNAGLLFSMISKIDRINVVILDICSLNAEKESRYAKFLESLACKVADEYKKGHFVQINLLTDRVLLDSMNNCNAGDETIALCPDGNFYVCPAFYSNPGFVSTIGSIDMGVRVQNPQLYKINHAPICRICDAYQCRRCVWLNRKMTLEVNTPSKEQCVVAHIERNASRRLLFLIREFSEFMPQKEIPYINYLDPFKLIVDNDKN